MSGIQPRYSILLTGEYFSEVEEVIKKYLSDGIKVFWFGNTPEDIDYYSPYVGAELLYVYPASFRRLEIIDGNLNGSGLTRKSFMEWAEKNETSGHPGCSHFDPDQYLAEHSTDRCTEVIAGAGAGKTKVMVDHVLFLFSTVEGLKPSQIVMITYTNAATDSMRSRFQSILLKRYNATHNLKFLEILEKQAQMTISTIDSFLYARLKMFGPEAGFSPNLRLKGMKKEVDRITNRAVENYFKSHSLPFGLTIADLRKNVREYLYLLLRLGFTFNEILNLKFDECEGEHVYIQSMLYSAFKGIDRDYTETKEKTDSMDVEDLLPTFVETINRVESRDATDSLRYVIIDEFQDTNTAKIEALSALVRYRNASLFAVGDGNQGIYRFIGATSNAFADLFLLLEKHNLPISSPIHLRKNYRSSKDLVNQLNPYFRYFYDEMHWLYYPEEMKPFVQKPGKFVVVSVQPSIDKKINLMKSAANCASVVRNQIGGSVAIISYANYELQEMGKTLRAHGIPHILVREGDFYTSSVVRDFYAFLSSFVYSNEPSYLFNYLMSPYCSEIGTVSIEELSALEGDREKLLAYLKKFVFTEKWISTKSDFEKRPVMSVILEAVDSIDVVTNYANRLKKHIKNNTEITDKDAYIKRMATEYRLNLDKLLVILQQNLSKDYSTVYDICNFLEIAIATNREEDRVNAEDLIVNNPVRCMTVHKAKGLEYDTVILPLTTFNFSKHTNSLLVPDDKENDEKTVSYRVHKISDRSEENATYSMHHPENLKKEEELKKAEVCHLLYVAMTRAKYNLIVYLDEETAQNKNIITWSGMLKQCNIPSTGIDNLLEISSWQKFFGSD